MKHQTFPCTGSWDIHMIFHDGEMRVPTQPKPIWLYVNITAIQYRVQCSLGSTVNRICSYCCG